MAVRLIELLRRMIGVTVRDPISSLGQRRAMAHALQRNEALTASDHERLAGVISALDACTHTDQLLVMPIDRWILVAAAEQELALLWDRYERGSDQGSLTG